MSAGGIRFESAPFFARAEAARSAIDDAVSKPFFRGQLARAYLIWSLTESKQHADWVHLRRVA